MKKVLRLVFLGFITFLLGGCGVTGRLSNNGKTNVVVSILPQKQFVEKIGGDIVNVSVMIPPGFSPATYEPTPSQIKEVSEADVYFRVGQIGFEQTQMDKLKEVNPSMKIVDTSKNIEYRHLEAHDHGEDEHEKEADHEEETMDPHVWLSPKNVLSQAEVIRDSLVELEPENRQVFESNFDAFKAELEQLDTDLTDAFAPIKGKTMLVYHPAFGYLADDYGFVQEHFEIEGKEPTVSQIHNVAKMAKAEGVKVIFVQKQFSHSSAHALAQEIGGSVVQIDPLDPDYLNNLRSMVDVITKEVR